MSLAMNWPGMGDPTKRRKTLRFLAITAVIAISVGVASSLIQGQLGQNDPLKVCINDKDTPFVISATLELYVDNNRADIPANICLLYTSPSPRDLSTSRMPSSA